MIKSSKKGQKHSTYACMKHWTWSRYKIPQGILIVNEGNVSKIHSNAVQATCDNYNNHGYVLLIIFNKSVHSCTFTALHLDHTLL